MTDMTATPACMPHPTFPPQQTRQHSKQQSR